MFVEKITAMVWLYATAVFCKFGLYRTLANAPNALIKAPGAVDDLDDADDAYFTPAAARKRYATLHRRRNGADNA